MVNGRLPFNDAQIAEMEEEMKMQRLKFERNISFGTIVFSGDHLVQINCTLFYFLFNLVLNVSLQNVWRSSENYCSIHPRIVL